MCDTAAGGAEKRTGQTEEGVKRAVAEGAEENGTFWYPPNNIHALCSFLLDHPDRMNEWIADCFILLLSGVLCSQSEADSALRKARLLQTQRREEYDKTRGSHSRTGDEQTHTGGRTQERKRKMEEEALQKVQLNKHTVDCVV